MKCANCGKEMLIINGSPFCSFDVENSKTYVCVDCGMLSFFNPSLVTKYQANQKLLESLKQDLVRAMNSLNIVENRTYNSSEIENEIRKFNEAKDQLIKMGITGKAVTAIEESINEYEKVLKSGKDQLAINNLTRHIKILKLKIEALEKHPLCELNELEQYVKINLTINN